MAHAQQFTQIPCDGGSTEALENGTVVCIRPETTWYSTTQVAHNSTTDRLIQVVTNEVVTRGNDDEVLLLLSFIFVLLIIYLLNHTVGDQGVHRGRRRAL